MIPMRRKELERTDEAFISHVLSTAEDIFIGFSTEGAPYVLPLNHVYADGKLYMHCALEGRKMRCIEQNPQVGFSTAIDVTIVREKSTTIFKSVVGTGRISIVEDTEEKCFALDSIAKRFEARCPVPTPPKSLERVAVLRIDIESVCGKEKTPPASA